MSVTVPLLPMVREPPHAAFAEPLSAIGPIRDTAAAEAFEQQAVEHLNRLTALVKAHTLQSASSPGSRQTLSNSLGTQHALSSTQDYARTPSQHSLGGVGHSSVPAVSSQDGVGLQSSRQEVPATTRHDYGLSGRLEQRGANVLIEEIENVGPCVQQEAIVPVEDLLLVCGMYCADSAKAPCARHEGAFLGASYALQFPQHSFLYSGWAPPAVQEAAEKLLCALAEHWAGQAFEDLGTPSEGHNTPEGRAGEVGLREDAKARVVLDCINGLLRHLARVLVPPSFSADDMMVDQACKGAPRLFSSSDVRAGNMHQWTRVLFFVLCFF